MPATGHGPFPPHRRATAIACAAQAVVGLYFIDLVYDGEVLTLSEYANIILRDENPLDCYHPGNCGPEPDFRWQFAPADTAEIVLLAAVLLTETGRDQRRSRCPDRGPGDEDPDL